MFDNNLMVSPSKDGNEALNIETAQSSDSPDPLMRNSNQLVEQSAEKTPLLFVDVNLGGDNSERIVVFEGDTARDLALKFCDEHNLDEDTLEKLE
jgi:hypothetical protein